MQQIDEKNNEQDWSDIEPAPTRKKRIARSYVTISKMGLMTLSSGFINAHFFDLGCPTHVSLSYSKNTGAIIFNFDTLPDTPGSKILRGVSSWKMSILHLFTSLEIELPSSSTRYSPCWAKMPDGIEKMVIYLKEPQSTKGAQ